MPETILVVDDDPDIARFVEVNLRSAGYDVAVAADGEEALTRAATLRPDLVLLDVMMPLRSGYEVCQRMRERPDWRHIKIIMLTAKGRDVEASKGRSLGADLYITKPFSTKELVARIEGLLEPGAT